MKRPFLLLLSVCASFLLLAGCSKKKTGTPIARVEESIVTEADLATSTNLNFYSRDEAARRWLENRILLEHAKKGGLINRKALSIISDRNDELLTVQLLIDSLLVRTIQITEEDIRGYYAGNQDQYLFEDRAALVLHIGFLFQEHADSTIELLKNLIGTPDSLLATLNFDRQIVYFGRLIPVLDDAIFLARANTYVGPVESDFGYHIFLVEHFFDKNESIPIELVTKQIRQRLFEQRRPITRAAIIDSLREVLNVEVYEN